MSEVTKEKYGILMSNIVRHAENIRLGSLSANEAAKALTAFGEAAGKIDLRKLSNHSNDSCKSNA